MRLPRGLTATVLTLALGGCLFSQRKRIFSWQREPVITYLSLHDGLPVGEFPFRKQCLALRRGMTMEETEAVMGKAGAPGGFSATADSGVIRTYWWSSSANNSRNPIGASSVQASFIGEELVGAQWFENKP